MSASFFTEAQLSYDWSNHRRRKILFVDEPFSLEWLMDFSPEWMKAQKARGFFFIPCVQCACYLVLVASGYHTAP
jgi:hypothetical protein